MALPSDTHLWPFAPNWRNGVTVEFSFRTDIITSRSGREQRRSQRGTPRKSISYRATLGETQLRAFNRSMSQWQNQQVAMPDPTRSAKVDVPAGADRMTVFPVPDWLAPGAHLVLDHGQAVTALTVDELGEALLLDTVLADSKTVRPALTGQLAQGISGKLPTNGAIEVDVRFDVKPGSEAPNEGAPGIHLFNGREVFARSFNWANELDVTYSWDIETLDFGFGVTQTTRPVAFGSSTRKATFVQQGAGDMLDLEQFFQRQKGQRGEFYMPSGVNDLPLKDALPAGATTLTVAGTETFDAYDGDPVHQAIAVHFKDGRKVFRKIAGMEVVGADTVLQVAQPFLTDVAPVEISRISWLTCSRFASDQFTQEWLTSTLAQTQLAVKTLPDDLPVENPIPDHDGAGQWLLEVWGERGISVFDGLDYLVNTAYAAVWFVPEAWVTWESTQEGLGGLNYIVNYRFPEITSP